MALVVGNAGYKVRTLLNPVNDAQAVAETLERQLKFDKVILRRDLGLEAFRAALLEIAKEADRATIAVIFFAGHGIEVGGRNYLIPVDATLADARHVTREAIELQAALDHLNGASKLKLVILDACRTDPFPLAGLARTTTRGLAVIEPGAGTVVAYAAKAGTVARDGSGLHSPFTTALLKRLSTPGLDVRRMLGYVRDDVLAATEHEQEPQAYFALGGDEVILAKQASLSPPPPPPTVPVPSAAERAWMLVKDTSSIAVLEAFILEHGPSDPFLRRAAQKRVEELRAIDERRRKEEAKAAEESRRKEREEVPREVDLRRPIDNLFAAWGNLDLNLYVDQWAPEGFQLNHKTRARFSRAELRASRQRDFTLKYSSVYPEYEVRLREVRAGVAIFDVKYTLTLTTPQGRRITDRGCETYHVAQRGGRWLIIRNDDYVRPWASCL